MADYSTLLNIFKSDEEKQKKSDQRRIVLILGNGFDLQCGLKTRYQDFFNYCMNDSGSFSVSYKEASDITKQYFTNRKNFQNIEEELEKIEKTEISVWDLYFFTLYARTDFAGWNWINIEEALDNSIVKEQLWEKVYEVFKKLLNENESSTNVYNDALTLFFAKFIYNRYYKKGGKYWNSPRYNDSKKTFYEALRDELISFEERFGLYIKKQFEDNENEYIRVSQENITRIYNQCMEKAHLDPEKCTLRIISFNYIPLLPEDLNDDYILNIHDDYETPIFGIGSVSMSSQNGQYYNMFSKSTRERNAVIKSISSMFLLDDLSFHNNIIATYGLSFGTIDLDDYRKIFIKTDLPNVFRKCYFFYPNSSDKRENNRVTTEISESLQELFEHMAPSTTYPSLLENETLNFEIIDLVKICN